MRPALRVVDQHGELVEPPCSHISTCEHCSEREDAFETLQRKLVGALAEIGRLKRDPEAEARKHELWHQAECAHEWWRLCTGHFRAQFAAEEFYAVLPRLKERDGLLRVLKGICALVFDPNEAPMKNGRMKRYDGWHLVACSRAKLDERCERAPGKSADDEATWRIWLVRRIEANLTG